MTTTDSTAQHSTTAQLPAWMVGMIMLALAEHGNDHNAILMIQIEKVG